MRQEGRETSCRPTDRSELCKLDDSQYLSLLQIRIHAVENQLETGVSLSVRPEPTRRSETEETNRFCVPLMHSLVIHYAMANVLGNQTSRSHLHEVSTQAENTRVRLTLSDASNASALSREPPKLNVWQVSMPENLCMRCSSGTTLSPAKPP
jgi:hypothetical protein